jgi:hypothetical protein
MKNKFMPKVAALGWKVLTINNSNSYNLNFAMGRPFDEG